VIFDLVSKSTTLRALVLQMYGTGNAPAKKDGLLVAIRGARACGVVVVSGRCKRKRERTEAPFSLSRFKIKKKNRQETCTRQDNPGFISSFGIFHGQLLLY